MCHVSLCVWVNLGFTLWVPVEFNWRCEHSLELLVSTLQDFTETWLQTGLCVSIEPPHPRTVSGKANAIGSVTPVKKMVKNCCISLSCTRNHPGHVETSETEGAEQWATMAEVKPCSLGNSSFPVPISGEHGLLTFLGRDPSLVFAQSGVTQITTVCVHAHDQNQR